jgi:hypothetical protein
MDWRALAQPEPRWWWPWRRCLGQFSAENPRTPLSISLTALQSTLLPVRSVLLPSTKRCIQVATPEQVLRDERQRVRDFAKPRTLTCT